MTVTVMHEKKMSKILDLQEESKTQYGIVETLLEEEPVYGIVVIFEKNGISFSDMIQFISNSRAVVVNILTYLYENSVDAELCRNVISDLVPESA